MEAKCAHCGKDFVSQRKSRLYCSVNCKQLAYYKRNGLILKGHQSQRTILTGVDVVKDVKSSATISDSFIARLNTFIESEVERRLIERIKPDVDTEKTGDTIKPYVSQSKENSEEHAEAIVADRYISSSEHHDVKDDITCETSEVNPYFTVSRSDDEIHPSFDADSYDSNDNLSQQPVVKGVPEESFTGTDVELKGHSTSGFDTEFDRALAALENFTINDNNEEVTENHKHQSSISVDSVLCDNPDTVSIKDADNVKDKPEMSFTPQDSQDASKPEGIYDSDIPSNVKDSFSIKHDDADVPLPNANNTNSGYTHGNYTWRHSNFLTLINKYSNKAPDDILRYRNDPGPAYVLRTAKCLLRHLMILSSQSQVSYESLVQLSNGFYTLVNSREFRVLPSIFPYRVQIAALQGNIREIAIAVKDISIRLHLPVALRAEVFAILSEMKDTVKDIKLSDLKFTLNRLL